MKFIDKVNITVQAGRGGNGLVSFLRTKSSQKGGPNGGNGGNGGNIIVSASANCSSLSNYRIDKLYKAQSGENGGKNNMQGKRGLDLTLMVPVGTMIYEDQNIIADLAEDGQSEMIAMGGKGGFGNAHFKSSIRRAPKFAEIGEQGEDKRLTLELKMIADVGLVGLPNSGKSTLLSIISNAKPEIADYPFTTLTPNLGVVDQNKRSFLAADIPGLIEGASKGKGLGDEFLRHIERTRVIIHLIDISNSDWQKDYQTISNELIAYKKELSKKQKIVVLAKSDMVNLDSLKSKIDDFCKKNHLKLDHDLFIISAKKAYNLKQLINAIFEILDKKIKVNKIRKQLPIIGIEDDPNAYFIKSKDGVFEVSGKKIEGFAKRTDFNQPQGLKRLRDIFSKMGIEKELFKKGGKKGSKIRVAGKIFEL